MQAIPFIDFADEVIRLLADNRISSDEAMLKIRSARYFYCQTFYPEMITEYFEDWEQTHDRPKQFMRALNGMRGAIHRIKIMRHTKTESTLHFEFNRKHHHMDLPLTIDQFLSDCKRASLPMTWKLDVAEINNLTFTNEDKIQEPAA